MANVVAVARWLYTASPHPARGEGYAKTLLALAVVAPVALACAWPLSVVLP